MSQTQIVEHPNASADWILLDVLQFVNNIYIGMSSVRADDPLDLSVPHIFSEVVSKLAFYAHCSNGLHLLERARYGSDNLTTSLEVRHLYIDRSTKLRLGQYTERDQLTHAPACTEGNWALYVGSEEREVSAAIEVHTLLQNLISKEAPFIPTVTTINADWERLFSVLNCERAKRKLLALDCKATKLLIIPMSKPDNRMPGGNLGTVILWQNENNQTDLLWNARAERLLLAAKIIGRFLVRLFATHYGVTESTFLPSYRVAGSKNVGIMFADIRDFTPTMEITRNFNLGLEMQEFMRDYCREMSDIIVKAGGRVSGYSGDGIMALFGEYNLTPKETMAGAVEAAKQMVTTFDQIKKRFVAKSPIQKFFAQAVEPLDFRLGIGINFGEVIFDYFGAEGSRVYSALGDHVNFAQRLESQAGRHDDRSPGGMRAPILLSRPAWLAGELNLKFPEELPVTIQVKGKSYDYPAYQVWAG
jgi:class 3 adenylate cyclase